MQAPNCILYDFVSYSQLPSGGHIVKIIVYDTILSAIHNSLKACGLPEVVVYDFSAMSKNDVAKISIIIEFAKNRYTF